MERAFEVAADARQTWLPCGGRFAHRASSFPEVEFENVDQHGRVVVIRGVGPRTVALPEGALLLLRELAPLLRIEIFERWDRIPH